MRLIRNTVLSLTLFTLSLTSLPVFAGGGGSSSNKPLAGSYPIVLVHGILGFDDTNGLFGGLLKYWGGMDDYLRDQGAKVLTPGLTAMNNNTHRGYELKDQVNSWMAANGYSKVNLMGHSQGGLTSRYMITNLGMSSKIAVNTSINSVHYGTPFADIGLGVIPDWLEPFANILVSSLGKLIYGGGEQDVLEMATSLTTGAMATFNQNTPNKSGVRYYSYGSYITIPDLIQHPLMGILSPITAAGLLFKGESIKNDGVVPLASQKWGSWKGGPSTNWYTTGVDHLEATNFSFTGETWFDVEGYYLKMAKNAKSNQ